jgi:hypothetical protein
MTLQFQLVSEVIAEAQFRGDIQGQDDRYTAANLLRMFNDSAQKFRLMICNMGFTWFLEFTAPAALSTAAQATGETFSQQDWPLDCARIYGIHVLAQTGLWVPLKPIGIGGIRDYQVNQNALGFGGFGAAQGMPAAFALQKHPQGVAAAETVGKILLTPKPTVARSYRLLYLPVFTPLIATHTYNSQESHVEWIIWIWWSRWQPATTTRARHTRSRTRSAPR